MSFRTNVSSKNGSQSKPQKQLAINTNLPQSTQKIGSGTHRDANLRVTPVQKDLSMMMNHFGSVEPKQHNTDE
jgi:hypothetical protein